MLGTISIATFGTSLDFSKIYFVIGSIAIEKYDIL
jgi:hypothetical protein